MRGPDKAIDKEMAEWFAANLVPNPTALDPIYENADDDDDDGFLSCWIRKAKRPRRASR